MQKDTFIQVENSDTRFRFKLDPIQPIHRQVQQVLNSNQFQEFRQVVELNHAVEILAKLDFDKTKVLEHPNADRLLRYLNHPIVKITQGIVEQTGIKDWKLYHGSMHDGSVIPDTIPPSKMPIPSKDDQE